MGEEKEYTGPVLLPLTSLHHRGVFGLEEHFGANQQMINVEH